MKILFVSDTHSSYDFKQAIAHEQPDLIFHAGDSQLPPSEFVNLPMIVVRGNCDFGYNYEDEVLYQTPHFAYFITHGHLYNVKLSLEEVSLKAKSLGADICLFGHSHVLNITTEHGVLCLNPGSYNVSRGVEDESYIVFDEESRQLIVKRKRDFTPIEIYHITKELDAVLC